MNGNETNFLFFVEKIAGQFEEPDSGAAMQKRLEEKRLKRLRDFISSSPENKRCE